MRTPCRRRARTSFTLRGRVYHRIREDILNGRYEPDEELREIAIGKSLGVSRTPVREALRQLELEDLVYIIPNKGAYAEGHFPGRYPGYLYDPFPAGGLSARLAAEKITEEQLADLQEVLMLAEFHAAHGNFEKVFEMDSKFHELMYEASGSKQLHHLLSDYHHYVQLGQKAFRVHQCAGQALLLMSTWRILEAIDGPRPGSGRTAGERAHYQHDT